MPKRSRNDPLDEYECIARKVKRLERKLVRARREKRDRVPPQRRVSSSSSGSTCSSSSSSSSSASSGSLLRERSQIPPDTLLSIEDVPVFDYLPRPGPSTSATHDVAPPPPPLPAPPTVPEPPVVQSQPGLAVPSTDASPADASLVVPPVSTPQLNEELMEILGEDPSQKKIYGKDIHPDLVVRLQHIATTGLSNEVRKELLDKYRIPANCMLIDAPILNAEVKAAISEVVYKRDRSIEQKQKQIGSVVACIAEALTLLFSAEQTNTDLIKLLIDAQKLLCDTQNTDSMVRRNFILYNLKKELKDQLQNTKIDKFLFSEDLAETIKTAKAISKSGADLKVAPAKQPPKKVGKPKANNNLNWRGPPQSYRPTGTHRTTPANKSRRDTASRPSSRPASSRSRRH